MDTNNITGNPDPGAPQLSTSGGEPAVGGQNPQEPVIKLSELKNVLGKDFKDKESALKSLKDTQSYVGQVGQLKQDNEKYKSGGAAPDAAGEIAALNAKIEAIQEDTFFDRNEQFRSIRPIVKTFAKANGKTLSETVELPDIKELVTKVSGFDKSQNMRTVLESNPRLASSQDKIAKAQTLAGSRSRKALSEAADLAVQAVSEAFPDYQG